MAVLSGPIPPLYTVYVLQSTIRQASLYIGSTPNPPRRLKQHNGEVKGGARRTSRVRPWEMVGLVSGFPNMIAALKFEWALNNPHVSLHIPEDSRISRPIKRRGRRRLRRPPHKIDSIMSNLHLLLRVPSFVRWPLKLHFFAPKVHSVWSECCNMAVEPLRTTLPVYTDFPPSTAAKARKSAASPSTWGIHNLPLDYSPIKDYVKKTHSLYSLKREGHCVFCRQRLSQGKGIYATCSCEGCEATGHVSCWSRHMLGSNTQDNILPISGRCPTCKGEVLWGDMMKEISLRLRGQKKVEKLLKGKSTVPKEETDAESD
ncbi:GIY-YIG catalytic domain-containing protein [Xylaria sp. CBS 124048]|nr:GIY-YIG catalytic domain-containing protein [Xylaria sp. CBS 124048]